MKTSLHKNMKKLFVLGMLAIMVIARPQHTFAQQKSVGFNNSTPDVSAVIDAQSGVGISQGVLFPPVNLTTPAFTFPSPGPATHLFVVNTSSTFGRGIGLYRNSGTAGTPVWKKLLEDGDGWNTTGNSGTTASTSAIGITVNNNFIGTTDLKDFVFVTNNLERMRINSTGGIGIGTTATPSGPVEIIGNSSNNLVLSNFGNPTEIWMRRASGTIGSPTTVSTPGTILGRLGFYGLTTGSSSYTRFASIRSELDATSSGSTDAPGNLIFSTVADGTNTLIDRMRIDNLGNVGINKIPTYKLDVENGTDRSYFHAGTAGTTESYVTLARSSWEGVNAFATIDDGVEGTTASATYNGIYGKNTNGGGDAIWGQNTATNGTGVGTGVVGITGQSGTGSAGVWGENSNTAGTGVVGAGQGQAASVLVAGSGGAFTGNTTGASIRNNSNGISEAIYTVNGSGGTAVICRVNHWSGTIQYKILGTGTVSTIVNDLSGNKVVLHAPETPEIYFQDYGNGKLVNGKANIKLDPIITKNIVVNEKHPLQVFIQLNGDCKGVFVSNRTATGFDVTELQDGNSNVEFTWSITANRADEDLGNGRISKNTDTRFEPAPKDLPVNEIVKKVKIAY